MKLLLGYFPMVVVGLPLCLDSVTPFSWTTPSVCTRRSVYPAPRAFTIRSVSATSIAASEGMDLSVATQPQTNKEEKPNRRDQIRKEGGLFAFNTKIGALNPYGIYYGLVAILLGIPWFLALAGCQLLYFVTGNRIDRNRFIPGMITQVWGVLLMRLTRSYPDMENLDILKQFFKEKRNAMFIANHNSWQDIPYLGATLGWRNYKLVSKKELIKVPILGRSIKVGGHITVDRSDRKSQVQTLKMGIDCLKAGVHLCTFPEGTRSRTGRLQPFKNGAFKMAHKAGAPVIPVAIVGAGRVHPAHWVFPYRPARGVAKVIVNEPIESSDKTESELADAVRKSLVASLPEEQRPIEDQ